MRGLLKHDHGGHVRDCCDAGGCVFWLHVCCYARVCVVCGHGGVRVGDGDHGRDRDGGGVLGLESENGSANVSGCHDGGNRESEIGWCGPFVVVCGILVWVG